MYPVHWMIEIYMYPVHWMIENIHVSCTSSIYDIFSFSSVRGGSSLP